MEEELTTKPIVVEKKLLNFVPSNLLYCASSFFGPFLFLMNVEPVARISLCFFLYFSDVRITSIEDFRKYKEKILQSELDKLKKEVQELKPAGEKVLKG